MLCVIKTESGIRLTDNEAFLRGIILEERFGQLVTYSWRYMVPISDLASESVERGSADSLDLAIDAILDFHHLWSVYEHAA
jgi:hypothetical protein